MNREQLLREFKFKAVRSSGSGGQHVNKVSSKVELHFDIANSEALNSEEQARLLQKMSPRLTKNGVLIIQADGSRSQHRNKQQAIERCIDLITSNLILPKKRKETKPSKKSIEKRLERKKRTTQKKELRKRPDQEH